MLIALGFRPTNDSLSLYSSFLEKKNCLLFILFYWNKVDLQGYISCRFQLYNKVIQLFIDINSFSDFSHIGYYRVVSRVPSDIE